MSGTQPVAVYAMKVPAGDVMVPAVPDSAAMFRLSMAAIDPDAEPEFEEGREKKTPRATLKLIRVPADLLDDDSDDSDIDSEEDGDEESSDEEELNGGPSDLSKAKKPNKLDLAKAIAKQESGDEQEEDDSEEEAAAKSALMKIMKGKGKADINGDNAGGENDDSLELEEIVVCTLDPEKNYQQPLDIFVGEDEKIFFKVSGTHEVHLTGNYVIPADDGQGRLYGDEDEDDYDLSPDEDELDALAEMEDDESDELDNIADPRVMEVDTDEEAPKLVNPAAKGKNKRSAEDSEEEDANLDDIMAKSIKPSEPTTKGEDKPLTKSQKKKLKKLKKNDGEAAPVEKVRDAGSKAESKGEKKTAEVAKKEPATNGEKKVQFAENLEQGPTPSVTPSSKEPSEETLKETLKEDKKPSGSSSIKVVQGVTTDDRKTGKGEQAKKGSQVYLRYIGRLENGNRFDANTSGKPFSFKVGFGEVIKGWDIGVIGMAAGGERRLTIPAHLAYGKGGVPGKKGGPPKIPPNSKLTFDLKMLRVE